MVTKLRLKTKQTTTNEKKQRTPNTGLAKAAVSCFVWQFLLNLKFGASN